MTNPARELHGILKKWRNAALKTPENSAAHVRGFSGGGLARVLDEHMRAMCLIAELKSLIETMKATRPEMDMEPFERQVANWQRAVLNYAPQRSGWTRNEGVARIGQDTVDTLALLGNFLDVPGQRVPEAKRADVHRFLDEVLDALRSDETLPQEVRDYVAQCVRHARDCVDDFEFRGAVDLHDALARLWSALNAAAGESEDEPSASRLRAFADKIGYPSIASAIGSAPAMLLQLTGG